MLALMLALSLLLPGCKSRDTLWIVMDESSGMEALAEKMIARFQEEHPKAEINLQIVPTHPVNLQSGKEERDAALLEIRTAMAEGNGPDVFLLESAQDRGEPFFADVNISMREGVFGNISAYYDADTELGKEKLITEIMDAGAVNGARYVLPLRYDMPVLYMDNNQLKDEGCTLEMLSGTIAELYDAVLVSDNLKLATAATVTDTAMRSFSLNFYPELIDYDAKEILLTAEDMVPLLQSIQKARAAEQVSKIQFQDPPTDEYLRGLGWEYWNDISCYYIGGMDDLLSYAIYTCTYHTPGLTMLPIQATDGNIVVDVTYFGAVGADCRDPELAYEFLRLFLTEEGQWQENGDLAISYVGWPVRKGENVTDIALRYLNVLNKNLTETMRYNVRKNGIGELPILDVSVDRVQFATTYEQEFKNEVVDPLNDATNGATRETDIMALVQAWLDKVQQHLAEE